MGILVGLGVVTVTFFALVFAFILRSQVAVNWRPIHLPPVLWLSSGILVASSLVLERARHLLRKNDQQGFHRLAVWATGLGIAFLLGQLTGWLQMLSSGVVLDRNPHSAFIFIFSGLHGAHILVGLAGLYYIVRRTRVVASGPKYQMTTRVWTNAVSVFWHYLDGLWLALFGLLVLWKR